MNLCLRTRKLFDKVYYVAMCMKAVNDLIFVLNEMYFDGITHIRQADRPRRNASSKPSPSYPAPPSEVLYVQLR